LAKMASEEAVTTVVDTGTSTTTFLRSLVPRLLGLSADQASFQARGFVTPHSPAQRSLEAVGRTFIAGYNAALAAPHLDKIIQYIRSLPLDERGFAAEGAAMGVAVVDALPFRRPMLPAFVAALDSRYTYLVHVGCGWAIARVPWRRQQILASLDSVHRWLAIDGLGFHDTYFYHKRVLAGWRREQSGYAARAYDQGVGRALWFVAGGSAASAIRLVLGLPNERQGDLWSGLGLAMAYAGPAGQTEAAAAFATADRNAASYAQGVAFACEAHALALHAPVHTDVVARSIWNLSACEVAGLVREARAGLSTAPSNPPQYQNWRDSVAQAFLSVGGDRS
jgi:hypothetical protein